MDLSLNLKGLISQRLIPKLGETGRIPAIEVMLNTPLMADMIFKGEVHEMKELIAKSNEAGMQTFDQALFDLYEEKKITFEDALRNADSVNDIRLRIKLESETARKSGIVEDHRDFELEESGEDERGGLI
jgi:twitching motility protein PilU